MVISGPLPVELTVKNHFRKSLFNQKLRIQISGGVLEDSFFYTMVMREAISEKQPRGKKLPKSDATVNITLAFDHFQL